jgi:phage terminase large subunit-like protein
LKQYERYIKNVKSGGELVCELTRLAVDRHLSDLQKPDFPFYFDEGEADKVLKFFSVLRHTSGSLGGKPFNLQDNQAFLLAMLFGWRRKENGKRRFTQAYFEMARKAGKSEFAAGVQIYTGFFEGEEGAQVYTAATTREQANMVFRAVKKMCRYLKADSKTVSKQIDVMANSVVFHPTDSFIQKVSADAGTLDGLNPHNATIDEYHAHKTDEIKGVMQTGMGSRDNPLLLIITTAGFEKEAPCYRVERANAISVLKGERKQDNLFTAIFTLDDGDDWKDERIWKKANPNLGSTPSVQYLREQVQDAINKGSSTMVQVLTKNFNLWLDAPKVWIPEEDVKAVMRPIDISEFYGREVFLGLDLAATTDLTALAIFAPGDENAPAICKVLYWLPEETVAKRNDVAPYRDWSEGGYINLTEGNIVDYGAVLKTILHIQENCQIHSIGHDQWNAWDMSAKLTNEYGVVMTPVLPRYTYLSNPTKECEKMVISKGVELDENPVLRWNFRNTALQMKDDNVMLSKDRSSEKIDGVAAFVNSLYVWLQTISQPSGGSYLFNENTELLTI